MTARDRHILATSGGFVASDLGMFHPLPGPIIDYALSLTGKREPKFCHLATALGDNPLAVSAVYSAMSGYDDVRTSHLELFPMPNVADPAAHLLAQDVIWVGGGSVANLLAVWRTHGLGDVMREAWERGIVLAGVSAGSICWHVGGTTDSFGVDLRAVTDGLGLLPYSNGVHYDSESRRRPLFQRLIADQTLPDGYATDDGVGLHFIGTTLHDVVSDRPGAAAYHVERTAAGDAHESALPTRRLP